MSTPTKYHYDCDAEFEQWWKENEDAITRLSDADAARTAFEAGANMTTPRL